jgi:co-chaperonin GroES (HSP10)
MHPQVPALSSAAVVRDPQRIDLSLEPLDDYLVVAASDEETETSTGLIIPASSVTECRTGIVTAVGPEAAGLEPGDKVLYPKEAGFDVRLSGVEVKVLRRRDLIARVHD